MISWYDIKHENETRNKNFNTKQDLGFKSIEIIDKEYWKERERKEIVLSEKER